jgi:hypothetical protein
MLHINVGPCRKFASKSAGSNASTCEKRVPGIGTARPDFALRGTHVDGVPQKRSRYDPYSSSEHRCQGCLASPSCGLRCATDSLRFSTILQPAVSGAVVVVRGNFKLQTRALVLQPPLPRSVSCFVASLPSFAMRAAEAGPTRLSSSTSSTSTACAHPALFQSCVAYSSYCFTMHSSYRFVPVKQKELVCQMNTKVNDPSYSVGFVRGDSTLHAFNMSRCARGLAHKRSSKEDC